MLARTLSLAALIFAASTSPAANDKSLAPITSAESVFVAKLTAATAGPVGLSDPPLRTYTLDVQVGEVLRGKAPTGSLAYSIRQAAAPMFPLNENWLIAARRVGKQWTVSYIEVANDALVKQAKELAALPAGWTLVEGKPMSPWAALKDRAWPKDAAKPAGVACSKSGRPALLAGTDIDFTVEQVPAAKPQKFKNDYGDGQFKLTVTNTGANPVEIPALLTDGTTIFWADSVVVMVQNQPKLLGGAGRATAAKPVTLKPGESVSGMIDTLTLPGVAWPRGGSRVYFDFALGEKTATGFFYYFSSLHDKLRDAAVKALNAG